MKVLKNSWLVAVCLILAGFTATFYFNQNRDAKYVFINETNDHRFDESIRMSIFASFKRTGVQNAVFISDSQLQNESAETVAARLFKELELGRNNSGRAILYFYSPEKQTLKIEVGYALESVLPDATVLGLELAAKSFIFSNRTQDFWAELINTLNIEIDDKEHGRTSDLSGFDFTNVTFLSGGAGITSQSYSQDWEQFQKEFKSGSHEERASLRAQKTVQEALAVYLASLGKGIGSADLDLLTSESHYFRNFTLQTSFQLYRNWRMYEKAKVDKVFELSSSNDQSLAFVFFKKNNPVLPLVFKKTDHLWRLHEPLSWSLFQRFEDSNRVFMKYSIKALPEDFAQYLKNILGQPLYSLQEPLTVEYLLKNPDLTSMRSTLIHLYGLDRVADILKSSDFNNLSLDDLKIAADTYSNLGQFSNFLKIYRSLAALSPKEGPEKENLKFYEKNLNFNDKEWRLTH